MASPTPENMHRSNGDASDVDPEIPYLEARGADAQISQVSPTGRRFGGFVGGMRRVFRGNRSNQSTSSPEDSEGKNSEGIVVVTTNPVRSPSSPQRQIPLAQPQPMTPVRVSQFPMYPHPSPPATQAPPAPNSRKSNSTAGDTTIIDHEPLPDPLPMGSPVYVDPQPGSDYAKMDSPAPPSSTASLGSYLSRVHKFFQDISNLPWVASERVTVDYYPGLGQRAARRRSELRNRSPLLLAPQRPVMSWYGDNNAAHQRPVDLFSQSSSPSERAVMAEVQIQGVQPLPRNARMVYPAVWPSNTLQNNQYPNVLVPASATTTAPAFASAPIPTPAPAIYLAAVRTDSSASSNLNEAPYNRPVYPHGYVPYDQHRAAAAQYAGDTIHR
jgi:hypothetical protein